MRPRVAGADRPAGCQAGDRRADQDHRARREDRDEIENLVAVHQYYMTGNQGERAFDELYAALDKLPDGAKVMSNMTKKNTLQWFTYMNMDSFVNWETGECKFNSDDFINILEFANKFEVSKTCLNVF